MREFKYLESIISTSVTSVTNGVVTRWQILLKIGPNAGKWACSELLVC